jgi:hypothetical protein
LPGTGLSYVQDLDGDSIKETVEDIKDIFDGDKDNKTEKKSKSKSKSKKK